MATAKRAASKKAAPVKKEALQPLDVIENFKIT